MIIDFVNNDFSRVAAETDFERSVIAFIENWFAPEPTIEVKTSGSTGAPKIIEVEKIKMMHSARRTLDFLNLKQGDTALLCLPVEYISGMMMIVRSIVGGLRLNVLNSSASPLKDLAREADFAAMTPLQVKNSLDNLSKIRKLIIGGAGVDASLQAELQKYHTESYETYGMSESLSHIALRQIAPKLQPDFTAFEGINIEQSDRGTLIFSDPEINPERFETNDLVEISGTNRFKFLGRADLVINSGGLKISPEPLEGLCKQYLENDVLFLGLPDEKLGQQLILAVEGSENSDTELKVENLLAAIEAEYTRNHKPKKVIYVAEFPRTPNGKVDRLKLVSKLSPEQ